MALKPSLKENKRYLLCDVKAEKALSKNEVKEALERALFAFLGEKGFAHANARVIDFFNSSAVLKCERTTVQEVRGALAFLKEAGGVRARVRVSRVSGSLKKLKQ